MKMRPPVDHEIIAFSPQEHTSPVPLFLQLDACGKLHGTDKNFSSKDRGKGNHIMFAYFGRLHRIISLWRVFYLIISTGIPLPTHLSATFTILTSITPEFAFASLAE
jgi:hypothetical protein